MLNAIEVLEQNGWYKGREVDLSKYEQWFKENNNYLHEAAKKFLKEFGGLELKFKEKCNMPHEQYRDITMWIDPIKLEFDSGENCIRAYNSHFNDELVLIAFKNNGTGEYFIGKNGEFYECWDEFGQRKGNDFIKLLYNEINGIRAYGMAEEIKMLDE